MNTTFSGTKAASALLLVIIFTSPLFASNAKKPHEAEATPNLSLLIYQADRHLQNGQNPMSIIDASDIYFYSPLSYNEIIFCSVAFFVEDEFHIHLGFAPFFGEIINRAMRACGEGAQFAILNKGVQIVGARAGKLRKGWRADRSGKKYQRMSFMYGPFKDAKTAQSLSKIFNEEISRKSQ